MMKLSSKPTRYRCCKILLLKCDWLTIVLKTFGTYLTSILKKELKDKRVELSGAVELAFISFAILSDNFKANEALKNQKVPIQWINRLRKTSHLPKIIV